MIAVLVVWTSNGRADGRALVPEASGAWRERLNSALESLEAGDHRQALGLLQDALREGRGVVVQVGRRPMASLAALRAGLEEPSAEAVAPPPPPPDREQARRWIHNGRSVVLLPDRPEPDEDRPGVADSYLEVATVARWILERLPPAGLAAYRSRYETAAAAMLERAVDGDDGRILAEVARLYPVSIAGLSARERLADQRYLDGGVRPAYREYRALSRLAAGGGVASDGAVVDSGADDELAALRSRVRRKLMASAARLGGGRLLALERDELEASSGSRRTEKPELTAAEWERLERLARRVDELPEPEPDDLMSIDPSRWGGEIRALGHPRLPWTRAARSWESSGWSAGVVLPRNDFSTFGSSRGWESGMGFRQGVEYPFVPLDLDGLLVISGIRSLFWLDGRPGAGKILRQVAKPAPVLRSSREGIQENSDSPLYTVTRWTRELDTEAGWVVGLPDDVLVTHFVATRMSLERFVGFDVTVPTLMRSLIAYDAATGRQLWRTRDVRPVTQRDPLGPSQVPVDISYTSPVVVRDGLVFASGWRDEGYVNALVRALDLRSGELVWETAVASSQMEATMFGELAREPFASFLLERDGVLYCTTSLGVVAALESRTGRLLWATAYDYVIPPATLSHRAKFRDLSWGANPPLLLDHVLVVAPRDSRGIFAIDTGTGPSGSIRGGCVLWSYRDEDGDLRDFLGYREGKLYFTGPAGIAALDVSSRNLAGELTRPAPARDSRSVEDPPTPERVVPRYPGVLDDVYAPGLLTREGVVFCDGRSIGLIDLELERRTVLLEEFPESLDGFEAAGRVHSIGDLLITTSRRKVSAFGGVRP